MRNDLENREGVVYDPNNKKVIFAEDWNELVNYVLSLSGGGSSLAVDGGSAISVSSGVLDGGSAVSYVLGVYIVDGGIAIF